MTNPPQGSLPRPWDSFDAYLFDIDGTLINCTDATHYFAFCEVLTATAGKPLNLDGVTAHGNTDIGILRDAFQRAAISDTAWRNNISAICNRMGDFVEARKSDLCTTVLPQVHQILQHLRTRGATLGVATGNLERIGKLKLQHAGLLHHFHFGGWSDGHEYRADVFRAAIQQARNLAGQNIQLCVLGDTPADVQAAHANHVPVIAVATGIYSFDQLTQQRPELCIASFADLI